MYDFMNRALKLGLASPVKEKPFEPIEPAKLSVFDADHPMPADATDAAGVRRWMTKVSEDQLDSMNANSLRAALEAMIVDHKPSAGELEYVDQPPSIPQTGAEWSGMIGRKGSGERVACKIIRPGNWNKSVVLWAHPDGCRSLKGDDPAVKKLLDSGATVLTIDVFPASGLQPTTKPNTKKDLNPPYAGFALTYNRSVLANRAHDLLTAFGVAQTMSGDGSVRVIAFGEQWPRSAARVRRWIAPRRAGGDRSESVRFRQGHRRRRSDAPARRPEIRWHLPASRPWWDSGPNASHQRPPDRPVRLGGEERTRDAR